MIVTNKIKIKNERGFHLSSVSKIATIAKKANGKVFILHQIKDGKKADAKDIFDMLSLGVYQGDEIRIAIQNDKDKKIKNEIGTLIKNGFLEK